MFDNLPCSIKVVESGREKVKTRYFKRKFLISIEVSVIFALSKHALSLFVL